MTMSKKNYIVFASLLRHSENLAEFQSKLEDYLTADNSRFSRSRFEAASKKVEQ